MSEHNTPHGWIQAKISDISIKGLQRKPATDESFTYVDIGSIDRSLKAISAPQVISGDNAPSRARKVIENGDVLVSLTRPNLNAVALVDQKYHNQIASTGFEVIKPFLVDSRYIFALVRSKAFIDQISGVVQGALYPAAKSSDVQNFEFPLPPLAEQKVIADKLDTLLAQVENTKARLERIPQILKRFRQSVLAAAVSGRLTEEWRKVNSTTDLPDYREQCRTSRERSGKKKSVKLMPLSEVPEILLPRDWTWLSMDEACLKITDGTHHSPKSFASGEFMYVTSKNVREGFLKLDNITYVDAKTHKEIFDRCDVQLGDVLYVKDGANTGLACVNTIEEEISLLSSVGVLRSCDFINPMYLQHYLNSPLGRKLMLDQMGGTAIKRLTLKKIASSPLSVPPFEEQTEIVRRVDQLFAHADRIEQQVNNALARVNNLTQSILAKAFRGELTEQWRKDNPELISGENSAEALLERIKAERETIKPKRQKQKA